MSEFNASLLREKFVIHDTMPVDEVDNEPIVALSNRMKFTLTSPDKKTTETYVVRAQNMHTTVRLAAHMSRDIQKSGGLIKRKQPFDWKSAYDAITKGYEKDWNPNRWVSVYHRGHKIFEDGEAEHHPFLDVIEQCDARNKDDYEKSMEIAKDAFKQAGKLVNINHDANIALIMKVTDSEGKCGVILRGPVKTTTFNLTALPKGGRKVKASQCLTVSAAFLEGIQLSFLVGMINQKIHYELIEKTSDEAHKSRAASEKLGRLNNAIKQFDSLFNVHYRPDKPNFSAMIDEAEEFARKILANEIETKISTGEIDDSEWVV